MGRPLPHDLAALIGREVRVDNDANCFALSEARRRVSPLPDGVGHHPRHRRRRWADRRRQDGARRNYIAGEFGHLRLPVDALEVLGRDVPRVACGCGHRGCIENYISGRGFEWMYAHFYGRHLPATEIIAHYQAGEPQAVAHVDRFMDVLAICRATC